MSPTETQAALTQGNRRQVSGVLSSAWTTRLYAPGYSINKYINAVNKMWCFEVTMFLSVSVELVLANKEIPEKCCRDLNVLHLLILHGNYLPLAARLCILLVLSASLPVITEQYLHVIFITG